MNIHRSMYYFLAVLFFAGASVSAQQRGGTIEDSWNRALKEKVVSDQSAAQPFEIPRHSTDLYTPWKKERPPESRPWPYLPKQPNAQDYFTANEALIDSLSNLYCVSNVYLRTLSAKNEAAMSSPQSVQRKNEFAYQKEKPSGTHQIGAMESLKALHAELLQLLDQCLYGK